MTTVQAGEATSRSAENLPTATQAIVVSLLKRITGHHAALRVLGVRARLAWTGPREFEHDGRTVRVVTCPSALAVRTALAGRDPNEWLVIITDRTNDDLGLGITARLAGRQLRSADPWESVKVLFEASRIDLKLVGESRSQRRDVAVGLLTAASADGWPAAPAGTLTEDHAMGVIAAQLGLSGFGPPPAQLDMPPVLAWSARPDSLTAVADLRARAGDALTDAVLDWCARRADSLAGSWQVLLARGRIGDLVPLGLVLAPILTAPGRSPARILLNRECGGVLPSDRVLEGWSEAANDIVRRLLTTDETTAYRVLARADEVLGELEAVDLVHASNILMRSLSHRWDVLGSALRSGLAGAQHRGADDVDQPLLDEVSMTSIEQAWAAVATHGLASRHQATRRAEAAVRLARWLAEPAAPHIDPIATHIAEDAWVDRAVASAWVGVDEEALAQGIRMTLAATRLRRDQHDRDFAAELSRVRGDWERPGVVGIESLIDDYVLPLATGGQPLLLIVADGMSAANARQITDDIVAGYEGWLEQVPADLDGPLCAVSALPSITKVSRTSLFCGEIASGDQSREVSGFSALCSRRGMAGRLFHKRPLDTSQAGYALADDVASAIDKARDLPVVVCVLNTIDDALDRTDPGGTDWTADTVKHLRPLLARARRAGRIVVLTSDHGHVIERRDGHVAPGRLNDDNRWRPASGPPPNPEEVLVSGDRVNADGASRVVLAVDERLRYSTLKAGYHGGAAPAEVVIPVVVLAPVTPPGWRLAPPPEPRWWTRRSSEIDVSRSTPLRVRLPIARAGEAPTLFDEPEVPAPPVDIAWPDLAGMVLNSSVYVQQRARAKGLRFDDGAIRRLLLACLAAPNQAVDAVRASQALGVPIMHLSGAIVQVQRLLNVEQYSVLVLDIERQQVVLDEALLREQFGIGL